jgi:pimeloyl-ACP methyl ester carboxylesterase
LSTDKNSHMAIVFVHGFGGVATDTWLDFPMLLASDDAYRSSDLFFFGYESKSETAAFSASQLFEFLDALHQEPSRRVLNPSRIRGSSERAEGLRYVRTLICAHSLGAIVTRLALLQAGKLVPPRPWPSQVRLVLFAPAHMGASIISLASIALAAIELPLGTNGSVIDPLLKLRFPALIDLTPGSDTLRELQSDTKELLANWAASDCLRAFVTHAQKDRVVRQAAFVSDHPTVPAPAVGHIGICKPTRHYRNPMTLLADALK